MQDQTQQKEWRKIINIEDITLDSTLNALEVNIPTLAKKLNVTRQCCWLWW